MRWDMDCSEEKVIELKERCKDILLDIKSTVSIGERKEKEAYNLALKALELSAKCGKGIYDLMLSLFTFCNPKSPALNPAKCAEALLDVPDTIDDCQKAIQEVNLVIQKYSECKAIYGAASVAFGDQGGYEISDALEKCDEYTCSTAGEVFSEYAKASSGRVSNNIKKLENLKDALNSSVFSLKECSKNHSECKKINKILIPNIQPVDEVPTPSLP